jgi:hypothetical protein
MTNREGQPAHPDRRGLLRRAAAAGLAAALDPGSLAAAAPPRRGLIKGENEKPGTTDWLLRNTRVDPKTKYRCPWVEGYCSATSVRAGDTLAVMVSTNPPSPFVIDLQPGDGRPPRFPDLLHRLRCRLRRLEHRDRFPRRLDLRFAHLHKRYWKSAHDVFVQVRR